MNGNTTSLNIDETEIIRLILQFLSSRELYKSARNLERESGVTNSEYNEDVLFLRQLILDGEWDAVFSYAEPLEKLEGFDSKTFRYLILKQKFMEILYMKSGVDGTKSNYSIDDMIKCLSQLEKNCPAKSDYMKLCWLLTVPDLYDQPEYANWNPENARRKCFNEVVKLVKNIMPVHRKKGEKSLPPLSKDRLLNLVTKGLCFESCVFYCIQRVKNDEVKGLPQNVSDINVLYGVSHDNTGNFLSWLQSLPQDSFCNHFDALSFKVDLTKSSNKTKQHLTTKRLQNKVENLSRSVSISSRPSTASRIEDHTREVPDSLTGVKNVANSYANFQYTKQGEQEVPNNGKNRSQVSLDKDTCSQQKAHDSENMVNEKESRHVIATTNSNSNGADNLQHQGKRSLPNAPMSVDGNELPKKDGRFTSSMREVGDSQDSLDQIKRHQENSVMKQLEDHERQQAERRRLLMETANVPASEASNGNDASDGKFNVRHPSDGHSLHLDENQTEAFPQQHPTTPVKHTKSSHENKPSLPMKKLQRESPLGKEPSPPCKDYPSEQTETKTPITSTPLAKKRSVPEPLNLGNISVSQIQEHKASIGHGIDSDLHQTNVTQDDVVMHDGNPYPKTPLSNVLHPGHEVILANGSGVLNTSTPKSCPQKMHNTPGPPESPVRVVDLDNMAGLNTEDETDGVIHNADTPSARRGPKINGVRRTLSSNGPPMSRNKGSPTPTEEVQEKTAKQDKANKAKIQNSPRNHISSNQTQVSNRKTSKAEESNVPNKAGNTFVVDNHGTTSQTNLKQTTNKHGSTLTQPAHHEDIINKLFTRQRGFMKNNPDAIRFSPVASLEDVQAIRAVAFHPAGDLFAVGSNSKALRLCAATGLTTYKKIDSNEDMIPPQPTILFKRNNHHRGSIYCVAWNDTGDMIATGSNDKTIKLARFDIENCTVLPEVMLTNHGGTIRDLTFATRSCGTTVLVSGSAENGDIKISDINTGKPLGKLTGHLNHIMSIFAAKDDIIVSGSYDNTVRLWDLRSQRCIDAIVPGKSCVVSVCANPSGTLLASGDEDGGCMIYDITAGRSLQFFKPHTSDCRSVRFSPDGDYLLTASYDTTISLVNMQCNLECSIPPYSVIAQHRDKVIQCRWHPQLMGFVSSSADKTASLWTLDC